MPWIDATVLREWEYFGDLLNRYGLVVGEPAAAPPTEPGGAVAAAEPALPASNPAALDGFGFQLAVRDLYRSAVFYTHALGFSVQYTRPFGIALDQPVHPESHRPVLQYVSLRNGRVVLGLAPWPDLPAGHHLRRGPEAMRGLGVEILVRSTDVNAAERQVGEAGFPIESPAQRPPCGATDFRAINPDGYYIRVTSAR